MRVSAWCRLLVEATTADIERRVRHRQFRFADHYDTRSTR